MVAAQNGFLRLTRRLWLIARWLLFIPASYLFSILAVGLMFTLLSPAEANLNNVPVLGVLLLLLGGFLVVGVGSFIAPPEDKKIPAIVLVSIVSLVAIFRAIVSFQLADDQFSSDLAMHIAFVGGAILGYIMVTRRWKAMWPTKTSR